MLQTSLPDPIAARCACSPWVVGACDWSEGRAEGSGWESRGIRNTKHEIVERELSSEHQAGCLPTQFPSCNNNKTRKVCRSRLKPGVPCVRDRLLLLLLSMRVSTWTCNRWLSWNYSDPTKQKQKLLKFWHIKQEKCWHETKMKCIVDEPVIDSELCGSRTWRRVASYLRGEVGRGRNDAVWWWHSPLAWRRCCQSWYCQCSHSRICLIMGK